MLWEEAIASIAPALGMTTTQCAMIFSLILIILIGSFLALLVQEHAMLAMFIGIIFGTIFFTYSGWVPLWSGSALAFAVSIIGAYLVSVNFGGK